MSAGVENPRSGQQSLACKGASAAELMDVALKGQQVSSRMFGVLGMYTSRMNRLGTASGAGVFHRPPLYTSSKHLKNPPPNPTQVAAAFANTDGGLEDGDVGHDGGSRVGLGQGRVTWRRHQIWNTGRQWRLGPNGRCRRGGHSIIRAEGLGHGVWRQRWGNRQQLGWLCWVLTWQWNRGTGHGVRIGLRVGWHRRR